MPLFIEDFLAIARFQVYNQSAIKAPEDSHLLLRRIGLSIIALSCFGLSLHADSVSFTNFQVLNLPSNIGFSAINDKGDIAGNISSGPLSTYGVLLPANSTTPIPITYPGSIYTAVTRLNNSDEVAGYSLVSPGIFNGFTYLNGNFSTVNVGNNSATFVSAINNSGDVGGSYGGSDGPGMGFLMLHGSLITFNVPGASPGTYVTGLNDAGVAVGYYSLSSSSGGFIRSPDGTFSTFFGFGPNNPITGQVAINNSGVIVSSYGNPATDTSSGLVRVGQTNYSFNAPGAAYTFLTGIDNSDRAIGYTIDPGNGSRLFTVDINVTATPEPASVYMWGVGLFCLAAVRRRFSRRSKP